MISVHLVRDEIGGVGSAGEEKGKGGKREWQDERLQLPLLSRRTTREELPPIC
jgi:hypothetical protein